MLRSLTGVRPAPRRFALPVVFLMLALADGNAQAGVLSGSCRTSDNQPAATLLIPYFEVDLDQADGATTLVSLNNASARPAVARVVLWTDWGIPTLAFDVYLTGYDIQSLDIRGLFAGTLPVTGPSVSPVGVLSQQDTALAGCGEPDPKSKNTKPAGQLSRVERTQMRAAHTGQPVGTGQARCLGSNRGAKGLATGYITVDVVNRCTPRSVGAVVNTPAHPAYFADGGTGLAGNSNILWGEYFYVDKRKNQAVSLPAVHIVADADTFSPGDYTFYGRYVGFDSRDNRAPLASLYYARYLDRGDVFAKTDLVVWRDNRQAAASGYDCAQGPSWAPLGEFQLVAFDEEENPTEIRNSNAFPLAAQKVGIGSRTLPVREKFGWLSIDLWHKDETHAQGWVTVLMSTEGRYTTSHAALRVDDLCNFGM